MREKTIHDQCVECNDQAWNDGGKHECKVYSNPFFLSIRILNSVIEEREMLVIWLYSIKGVETKYQDSISNQVSCDLARNVLSLSKEGPYNNRA